MWKEGVLLLQLTLVCVRLQAQGITVGFFCPGTYYVAENAGNVSVTVELLRGCPARDVIVTVQTVDGSARAGSDYDAVTTTLTFDVSMPTQVVTIPIHDDMIVENTESFTVALATNDRAVTLRFQTATVSIRDNDRVTIGFNQRTYSVIEGARYVSITILLTGTLARSVRVRVCTSDATARYSSDYGYYCTSYFYLTGSRTLTLYIQNDMVVENQFEFFYIRLWPRDSAVILDTATASVTIEDDDMVTIGFNGSYSVHEDAGSISITVLVLMNSLARDVVVTLSTQDDSAEAGMDYNTVSRNLTFNTAVTSQTVAVAIIDDLVVESSEIINLNLTSTDPAVIINPSTSTITIEDVDMVTIGNDLTAYSVSEDAGSVTVTLSVQAGTLDRDVVVTLSTINGTALSEEEYTPVSTNVIFNASTSTQTVDIPILDNVIVADPTVFSVTLTSNDTAVILNPASADITIEDEDVVTIGFDPATYTLNESAGNVSVTVNVLNGTLDRDMHVRLMTSLSGGTATATQDYTFTSSDLIFNATMSSQTVTITICEDLVVEGSETIIVTLTSADPAAILNPPSATVTIEDNDGITIGFSPTTYTVSEDVGNTSVVVSLLSGRLARDVIVSLQTLNITAVAGMDFLDTATNLTFSSSPTTQTVMVSILNDVVPEDMLEYFSLMLTSTDPAVTVNPATANVTIIDDSDMVTIGFNPVTYSVLEEDASSVNVTVSVLNGTLARDVVVTLSTVSGGTATGNLYTVNHLASLVPRPRPALQATESWAVLGNEATTLNCRDRISSPGGDDYTDVTITLTFGATVSTQMATVSILDDNVDEDTEFFNLTLTSTDNAAMLNPATATVSIKDMDLPTITTDPQNVFSVVPGHNVTFSVAAVGVRLTYTWQLEDGSALPSDNRFITNNVTLNILDVMLTDPDSYRCVVANAVGNVTSNSANFTLIDLPIITVPPQSIAADFGSNTEFSCTARGEGTLTFTWTTTAPVEIPSSVQIQINPQDGSETSTLTLTNVGTNHSGEYACSVRNERGSTGPLQATLTIVEISDIADRTVTLGTNATFTCSATGPGDIMYHWNKTVFDRNGVLVEIGFFNESRVSGENTSTLAIIDVGVRDEGSYTCFVSINGANPGRSTAILSTQGPTILEGPNSTNLLLGSDLTLECIAQNNVDAPNDLEFYWYHNGRSITPGSRIVINSTGENDTRVASSELVVMQVTDNDSGEYQCTVTNREVVDGANNTAGVTVLFTPVIQFLSGGIRRDATTTLLFECIVYAVPPVPFLEIRRRSQEGDIVLSTILGSSRMLTLQYTLENLMLNDSGVYVCVANNSVGLREQNFSLVVQAPPGEVNHTTVTRELVTLESVRLTWAQPEDNNAPINSYNVTYCVSINSSCVQQTSMETPSTETIILSQLIPAMTYTVYIRAENNAGQGPEPTEPYFFKSANEVDARPVGVNAAFVSSTGVVLVWQLPRIAESAGVNSFILSYSLQGGGEGNTTHTKQPGGEAMTRTVPYQQGKAPGVVVSGLDSDALYEFRVSVNYSDPVLLSAEASLTVHTNTTDSQPSTTVSLNVQRNFIIVSWPPPGGEDFVVNYILMYTSVSREDQQTASGNITIPSNQTSYNFTSPFHQPYSDYNFTLLADFGDGEAAPIVAPFAILFQDTVPSSPVNLQVQSIFHISLNLSWSAPLQQNGNITQYTVYYQPASSNVERSVVLPDYTPGSLYTLEELSPNTEYNIRVTASTDAGEGEGARVAETTTFGVYRPEITSMNPSTEQDIYIMTIKPFQIVYGPLSHYKIVVVRGSNVTNTRMEIPDNMLLPDSQRQTFYYVAATFSVEEFQCTFSIGNGKTDNETFVNLPLSSDQEYTVFIRLYSSLNSTTFEDSIPWTFTTPPMATSTISPTTTSTTTSTTHIVNINVIFVLFFVSLILNFILLIILFFVVVICIKQRRDHAKRREVQSVDRSSSFGRSLQKDNTGTLMEMQVKKGDNQGTDTESEVYIQNPTAMERETKEAEKGDNSKEKDQDDA